MLCVTVAVSEVQLWREMKSDLLVRYDLSQLSEVLSISRSLSLVTRISWLTVSKAALSKGVLG